MITIYIVHKKLMSKRTSLSRSLDQLANGEVFVPSEDIRLCMRKHVSGRRDGGLEKDVLSSKLFLGNFGTKILPVKAIVLGVRLPLRQH